MLVTHFRRLAKTVSFREEYSHREMNAAGVRKHYSPLFLETLNAKGLRTLFSNNSPISLISDPIIGWLKRNGSVSESIFEATGITNSFKMESCTPFVTQRQLNNQKNIHITKSWCNGPSKMLEKYSNKLCFIAAIREFIHTITVMRIYFKIMKSNWPDAMQFSFPFTDEVKR